MGSIGNYWFFWALYLGAALMVATLDAITGGFEAAFRSSVPLVLAVLFGLLLASVMSFFKKK